jgi:hypothetical protein
VYRIELPIKLKTNNELKRMWCHPKRNIGRALYRSYKTKLAGFFVGFKTHFYRRRAIVTIIYYTKRLQDEDNFNGCLKPLLDAM